MAELHGRVRRVPDRRLTIAAWIGLGLLLALAATNARAQDDAPRDVVVTDLAPTRAELDALAGALGSADERERMRAIDAISSLGEDALPVIRERIEAFRRARFDEPRMYPPMSKLRRAVGSQRADDDVDLAPGVPVVLRQNRERAFTWVSEMVLLLRALERIGGLEAGRAISALYAACPQGWSWEMRRVVRRMGMRALPMAIEAVAHDDRTVRAWGRWALRELRIRTAGDAVQQRDNGILADVLRAYGTVRDFEAMRVVVSLVTSERAQVREAARWATEQYGRNAVWQLRERYKNVAGEDADASWGWRRVMDELYRRDDEARLAPVRADFEAGLAAFAAGDLRTAEEKLDSVLVRAPRLDRRAELGPAYAAIARAKLAAAAAEDVAPGTAAAHREAAERGLRRAIWLAPDHPEARAWRADLAWLDAERARASGVVDLAAYRDAVALAPDHERASAALERLAVSADGTPASSSTTRRWALAAAGILLAVAALALLRPRRRPTTAAPPEADPTPVDATVAIPEEAADTLPGC